LVGLYWPKFYIDNQIYIRLQYNLIFTNYFIILTRVYIATSINK
jgi:hypothetical protein